MDPGVLTVRFDSGAALLEQATHTEQGGLFLPCPEPAPTVPSDVRVRIESTVGTVELAARVVQVFPAGMALTFVDRSVARAQLAPLFAAARAAGDTGGTVAVEWLAELSLDAIEVEPETELSLDDIALEDDPRGTLYDRIRAMSVPEKRKLALKGERGARLLLIKDVNKTLQAFLLKNPRITIDEVKLIAADRQGNPEALKMIGENRTWLQNPAVATALVRNPKTPSAVAVRLLDRIPFNELRNIAKSGSAGRAVVQAAKKKVIGNR